jgi:ABC-type phosphate transport system permease subunit
MIIKFQITSTKLQINLKFQTPMTETNFKQILIQTLAAVPVLIFEFWSLVIVCDLLFGAWNFRGSMTATCRHQ